MRKVGDKIWVTTTDIHIEEGKPVAHIYLSGYKIMAISEDGICFYIDEEGEAHALEMSEIPQARTEEEALDKAKKELLDRIADITVYSQE